MKKDEALDDGDDDEGARLSVRFSCLICDIIKSQQHNDSFRLQNSHHPRTDSGFYAQPSGEFPLDRASQQNVQEITISNVAAAIPLR